MKTYYLSRDNSQTIENYVRVNIALSSDITYFNSNIRAYKKTGSYLTTMFCPMACLDSIKHKRAYIVKLKRILKTLEGFGAVLDLTYDCSMKTCTLA